MRLEKAAVLARMSYLLAKGKSGDQTVADLRDWDPPDVRLLAGRSICVTVALVVALGLVGWMTDGLSLERVLQQAHTPQATSART
jgi:hypothetical protein